MKKKIVIVGSGPAGITTAIKLKKSNIDCTLLEKEEFPRNKTCGGLLTQKTIKLIENLIESKIPNEVINTKTNKFQLLNDGKKLLEIQLEEEFYLCDRIKLDNWLSNEYKKLGGKIIENSNVNKVDINKKTIDCTNGKSYKYDILIGADGANSRIRQECFNSKLKQAIGVETLISSKLIKTENKILLDLGVVKDGYLWVFPGSKNINIGVAETFNKEQKNNYLPVLESYLMKNYKYDKDLDIKGAFLPYGINKIKLKYKDESIYLIGDAKGLTNPLTGEGIYYGVYSGINMADLIIKYGEKEDYLKENYNKLMNQINKNIKRVFYLKNIFYKFKSIILKNCYKHKKFIKFYCDNEVQEDIYNNHFFKIIKNYYKQK